jgi:hypothetical protein
LPGTALRPFSVLSRSGDGGGLLLLLLLLLVLPRSLFTFCITALLKKVVPTQCGECPIRRLRDR